MLFGPEITSKLIKIYLATESLPKSVQYLINNRKISLFLSKKIFTVYHDKFEKDAKLKDEEGAQKRLESLNMFLRFIEATNNLSLSENFQLGFKALKLALSNPKKYIVLSHLYLAINSEIDFYVASKLLESKSKKLFEEITDSGNNTNEFVKECIAKIENGLKVTTFQEIFQTYMKLELEDIAYDSKKFDFYIDDGADNDWDFIEQVSPQIFSAEFFGLKSKNDIEKKSKTIKRYGLSKFGRRRVNKRRVYDSLLSNLEYSTNNSLRPEFAAEGSYIQFEKFNSINRVYQRIKGLHIEEKPLVFLDSSLVFQFLLEFEANDCSFPLWLIEQIINRFKFVCLPGVLYDLEKVGYNEFVREFLKKIINLPKLLEIENFLKIYQNKLSEYGFNNLNIEILSSEEYWRFYVQFHACLAKFLNASYLLIPLNLKKYYFNKNYYTGKFSIFNGIEFNATFLECLTAKKFRKRFKVNKEKAIKTEKESNILEEFVVSSNFKEWSIPNCLNEALKELDRKLIEEVNSFWLETFRDGENQQKNEVYFNDFFELIRKFEKNKSILKELPGYSAFFEEQEYYRAKFADINDYIRTLKKNFEYFVDINDNCGVINSEELYFLLFLFESTITNFLKDRFYLKAKHKSPALSTSINFNFFYKDLDTLSLDKKFNYQLNQLQLSNSINGPNNNFQKINIKSKKRNKRIFEFVPNLQYNDKLIVLLFEKFLFSRYIFHKSELNAVYREFIKFIRAKKEYRNITKGFSYNKFETLLKNSYEKILTSFEPYDIYCSKRLEDFLLLVNTYHRVRDDSFPLELAVKILNVRENELEILIYFLIHNGQMYREKTSLHPKYSLFFQAVKELHNNYGENNKNVLNLAKVIPRINYTPFCISNKKKKALSSQPELWIENSKDILDNAPIYSINAKNRVSYTNQLFEIEIKGETFAADVDTGAFKSLLSKKIADKLFPNKIRFKAYVSGYTQHTKCVEMIKDIPFYFNGHKFSDDFLIEEDIERIFKVEVVIGRDGYNKMLTRYYGKTLDTLFEKNNADEKTNQIQIPISIENIYQNSSDSLIKEAKSISKDVVVVQRGSAILTRMFGVYRKYIPTKEYENSIKLREDRNKKTEERIATLKKTLFKLYHDIGKEVEKYSYLAGIATKPTGVTAALLGGMHCHAGLRSLEGIIKRYAKIEKIYEQIQDKLKEKIEFSHWAIIKDKFEKAISLKQRVTDLYWTIGRGVHKRDTFDIRVSKFPSEKADLMVDLFDIALKYIFTSQQQKRNYYAQVFSDIIFGNSWFLSHAWLGSKPQSQRKALPTSLFLILFNIFRLDTTKIRNRVGDIRKFTKSSLADFKLACYSRVKKLFLDSYISDYLYNYDDDPKNDRYVGSKHFELEFDLLWSVWYAYVEWYANQNPGILDNIFDHDSPFRKKFGNSFFFRGFTGYSSDLFKNIQSGLHISKRHVFSMFNKLTLMRKNIGTSSFPNQHAIENALSIVENYLQVRHPKKEGNRVLAFQDYFFVNNILVSSKGTLLPKIYRNYLEVASNLDGSFPFSAAYYQKNHPNDYQRCSNFEIQVGTIAKDYFEFIQDRLVSKFSDLKGDKLLVVDSVNSKNSPKPIQDLLKLVKSFSGSDPKNFLNPSHQAIIGMAKVKLSDYVLATELPVWRKVGAKLVTGHIDLVLLIGDTLFICDYKPGDKANPNAKSFSHSFLMSLPQIATYSKLHRSQYNVKKIYCVTFNEDGKAWIYQDKILDSLENLLITKGYSDWLIWKKYII